MMYNTIDEMFGVKLEWEWFIHIIVSVFILKCRKPDCYHFNKKTLIIWSALLENYPETRVLQDLISQLSRWARFYLFLNAIIKKYLHGNFKLITVGCMRFWITRVHIVLFVGGFAFYVSEAQINLHFCACVRILKTNINQKK